jgi:lipopolysaccharide biosynthesis glycosyltransferase
MSRSCCCYVIDAGYLFPTLLSAKQARAATSKSQTDIKVFCIGEKTGESAAFAPAYEKEGVDLQFIPRDGVDNMPILFARFFLWRFLDPTYQAVIYIDGDTQIAGSLQPLLDVPLESGRFLAARDPMSLLIERPERIWREKREYFRSIGIGESGLTRYCNSGVLRFNRQDWRSIGDAAVLASKSQRNLLKFPDQDALNLVFGSDYLMMSYRWNFPVFFLTCGFQTFINPHIYHFMANPRPWNGPFQPWGVDWHTPYLCLARKYPELAPFLDKFGLVRTLKYEAQHQVKRLLERPIWCSSEVRERVMGAEREAYI